MASSVGPGCMELVNCWKVKPISRRLNYQWKGRKRIYNLWGVARSWHTSVALSPRMIWNDDIRSQITIRLQLVNFNQPSRFQWYNSNPHVREQLYSSVWGSVASFREQVIDSPPAVPMSPSERSHGMQATQPDLCADAEAGLNSVICLSHLPEWLRGTRASAENCVGLDQNVFINCL